VAAVGGYESVFLVGALASVVGAFLLARTPARTELAAAEAS
jgi:hypothetical protein